MKFIMIDAKPGEIVPTAEISKYNEKLVEDMGNLAGLYTNPLFLIGINDVQEEGL